MKSFPQEHPWLTFFLALAGMSVAGEVLVAAFGSAKRGTISGASSPPLTRAFPAGLNLPANVLERAQQALAARKAVG